MLMGDMLDRDDVAGGARKGMGGGTIPTGGGDEEPKGFEFRRYLFVIARRWWLLLACFFAALLVSLVMIIRQEPRYEASVKIQLTRPRDLPSNLQQRDIDAIVGDYVLTERNVILNSEELRTMAKERLGLSEEVFNQQQFGVSVDKMWDTAILVVRVSGLEPTPCADYANSLADAYVAYKASMRSDRSKDTVATLSEQAQTLSDQISAMEDKLMQFRRDNGLAAMEELGNPSAEALAKLSRKAMGYRIERMLLEEQQPMLANASDEVVLAALEYGLGGGAGLASPTLAATGEAAPGSMALAAAGSLEGAVAEGLMVQEAGMPPRWEELKRENALLKARLETYRTKYKEKHPAIVETLQKLQENMEALQVEKQFALGQYYSQLEALSIKERGATQVEEKLADQAEEVDRKRNEYASLERNLKRLTSLYDVIFNRLQEIDISASIQVESVVVLERAKVPGGPINPRRLQTLFMSALIGLAVGIALILLLDFMDDTLRYPDDAVKALRAPFLGMVPGAHWQAKNTGDYWVANVDASSSYAEAYRNIRSAILLSETGATCKSLCVVSSVPEEGKTTTCANLATSFALAGKRVLVVDADLHRGKLHKMFGLAAGVGLSDVVQGRLKWPDVIQRTSVERLDFIGTGRFPENPSEMMMRPALRQFLEEVEQHYDLVMFDAPPVLAVSETAVLAALADAFLLVVLAGRTSRKLVKVALRQLETRGANMLGTILNNFDLVKVSNYGAYSYYYHYYGYDYSYEDDKASQGDKETEAEAPAYETIDPPETSATEQMPEDELGMEAVEVPPAEDEMPAPEIDDEFMTDDGEGETIPEEPSEEEPK